MQEKCYTDKLNDLSYLCLTTLRESFLKRSGNINVSYKPKICPICGDTFIPKSSKQKYCKKEIKKICPICSDEYIVLCRPDKENPVTCSKPECKRLAAKVGEQKKTKICRVCGQHFHPMSFRQTDCNKLIEKVCEVCGKIYIGKCSLNDVSTTCSPQCTQKLASQNRMNSYQKETRICELCGEEFHPRSNTQKICDNIHYRTCAVCGKEFVLDTSKLRVDWPQTCSHECAVKYRFRNGNPMMRPESLYENRRRRFTGTEEEWNEYNEFLEDPTLYLKNLDSPLTLQQLARRFRMSESQVGSVVNKNKAQEYVAYNQSGMENEVYEFLCNYADSTEIIRHDRNQIKPYELDFWIPSKRLAVECNPTSTHNSTRPMIDDSAEVTPVGYHKMKTDMCDKEHIDLIHLFGYDWIYKKDIMKSIILNRLGIHYKRIYARKCKIAEIPYSVCRKFLIENHRQGNTNCSIRLGLLYEDELQSVMTFSKPRSTIGRFKEYTYELVRFCSKLNTTVIGGASKLFKYFIYTYHPVEIVSYSDRARMKGSIYETLGFTKENVSSPGYMWVDYKTNVAYNRINVQKHNIRKFLNDDKIDINQSETEIMSSHGYVQVFDSGTILWKWTR